MTWYLDSSAFLKLILLERESSAMAAFVADLPSDESPCSSRLLTTEAGRAAERSGLPQANVDAMLDGFRLILPTAATFESARTIAPPELRSLDALHLATAVELGADLTGFVTYDARLSAAAQARGVLVVAPNAVA